MTASDPHSDSEEDVLAEVPIDGVLDLHGFQPREVGELLNHYLDCCVEKRIPVVRIIHGKGIGTLRERVHRILERSPHVARFGLDSSGRSGWGATVAWLRLPSSLLSRFNGAGRGL